MKDIIHQIISSLNSPKNGYCRITHKRGWLDFLKDGDLLFTPKELHQKLWEVIDSDGNRPRGERLFWLRKTLSFTMMPDKRAYRTEEALERFIVASNGDGFYNQIPIGGGKESIDIGIRESESKFVFVELKSWDSQNSPLYAIIEILKNLVEYRVIIKQNLEEVPQWNEVELVILAPLQYYQNWKLKDVSNRAVLMKTVTELCHQFQTRISFMALDIEEDTFTVACRRIYEDQRLAGQVKVTLSEDNSIKELSRESWRQWFNTTDHV